METRRIPLFPLNVVLFPGMLLPLHIFEPRYREMVRDCLNADRRFGVCLIASGEEVGGPAEPCRVGTLCEILQVTPAEGENQEAVEITAGRMNLLTVGRERFEVLALHHTAPYLEADIRLLPDDPQDSGPEELAAAVHAAASDLLNELLALQGETRQKVQLPGDPEALSHAVAAILPSPLPVRQQLLEMRTARERLSRQLELLAAEAEQLAVLKENMPIVARPFEFQPDNFNPN